ncbi:hypothetical protein, partial [Kocuria sp. ZOR0020]|uniref:hypothetical protein n=1 Tax=Kocuria sp. ZOR0020 TaxID=1339234 RepID=UPI001E2ECAFF
MQKLSMPPGVVLSAQMRDPALRAGWGQRLHHDDAAWASGVDDLSSIPGAWWRGESSTGEECPQDHELTGFNRWLQHRLVG